MKKLVIILVSVFAFMMMANDTQAQMRRVGVNSNSDYSKNHADIHKYRVDLPATGTSDNDYPYVKVAMYGSKVLTIGEIKDLFPTINNATGDGTMTRSDIDTKYRLVINKASFTQRNKGLYLWVSIGARTTGNSKKKGSWFNVSYYVIAKFDNNGNVLSAEYKDLNNDFYSWD